MREILFRGKTVCDGDWIYGGITWNPSKNEVFIHTKWDEGKVIPETVGQYTGLCDKNGKKIFEGDIVKGKSEYFGNGSLNQKAVVLYDRGQFLLSFGETLEECKQLNDFEVVGVWNGDVEVIGNAHDNPELLNK